MLISQHCIEQICFLGHMWTTVLTPAWNISCMLQYTGVAALSRLPLHHVLVRSHECRLYLSQCVILSALVCLNSCSSNGFWITQAVTSAVTYCCWCQLVMENSGTTRQQHKLRCQHQSNSRQHIKHPPEQLPRISIPYAATITTMVLT